jgi:ribonuclease BN (tRNA processing enzyme)
MLETLMILGGGGWFPAHGRHTACALLRSGEAAIMIDAGTGVGRIVERPGLLDGVQRLDILLTHFHLDHIAGLAFMPAVGVGRQTTVWGPGALLYGTSTDSMLEQFLNEPYHPVPLSAQDIEVRDLPSGEFELAGVRVCTRPQYRHSVPTVGWRFDDQLAWITDTAYDPEASRFADGCDLLAHEAWFTTAEPRNPDIHTSAAHAAEVAADAGIERLLLIHLPPFQPGLDELVVEAQAGVPRSVAAEDGTDMSMLLEPRSPERA